MTYASSVSVIVKGMDLEVEIWALRLEFWSQGWDLGIEAEFGPLG